MHRFLFLLAACAFLVSTACGGVGGNTSSGKDVSSGAGEGSRDAANAPISPSGALTAEITLFYPVQVDGPIAQLVEDLAAQFNSETPGIQVNTVFSGDYDNTQQKLIASIQDGAPPELVILDTPKLLTLISMDIVEPLDSFIRRDGGNDFINDFFPSFMLDSVHNGQIYSIPFQRSTLLMFYNKDHFREAGLDPERPPQTWDAMADCAEKLTKRSAGGNVERWGILIPGGIYNFSPFAISNSVDGKNLMTPDGRKALFHTPENVEALQYLIDLSAVHHATPPGNIPMETATANFIEEKTSIVHVSSGNLGMIHSRAAFAYGVGLLPKSKRVASIAGGGNIHMIKGGSPEDQEAAWKFIRWILQPERQAQWNVDTGYIASIKSAFETTIMESYFQEVPQARAAYNHLETCYSGFCIYESNVLTDTWLAHTREALEGKITAEEALAGAQAEADAILSPYQE